MELHSPPPELAYIHNVQIGITSGKMRTGAYGGSARRTYGVLGDSVNLAARLMSKAEPGQTLVSKSIALAVSDNYHLRSLGHMQVKGKRDPIDVSLVVGPRRLATQAVFANYFNPLLGRENELAWMDQYAQMAREGSGQIIRLEASAGMGKSHLASVFSTQAAERGMHIARGACQIVSQGQAYAPWQQILQALLETAAASADESQAEELAASDVSRLTALLTNMNPDWLLRLPLLSDVLVIDIPDNATTAAFDARQRQDALFSLMVDIVAYQARRQPLLIVMEDIHWIDESSRGLIVALSRVLNHLPLLLLLVQRPKLDDGQPLLPELNALAYHRHLLLKELSPEGVRGLVVACLQGQPSPLALSLIQSQSQGNPFFVEELIDALTETEKLYEQEDGTWTLSDQVFHALRQAHCLTRYEQNGEWVLASDAQLSAVALGIPDSVHSAVLSRMDRLPESHKLTLKVSSVIGRLFAFSVLSQAHPDQFDIPLLLEQFQAIGERDFVQVEIPLPHLMYMFKHHITQEVAYGTLLDAQQRMLHGRVGEVLEQVSPYAVEQLAYHFSRSDDQAKALLYLDAAARKLQREYANETALYYYQQALEREERWEWRRGQVEILHTLGRREEEQAALYALEAAPEVPAFEVARLWAHYHEATGSYAEALEAIERALAINADAPECYLLGTSCYYLQGNLDTALEWVRRGLAIAERLESVHDQAQALKWVGIILDDQGNLAQGLEAQEQSAELLEQISHLPGLITALNSLGILYHNAGRWEEAIDSFTYSIQLSESIGDALGSARASMNLGLLYSDRGDPARANELYIYSAEQFQRIGSELGLGLVTANRGELMLVQGNPQEAIRLLLESVEILERINARIDLPELLWTAAEAALELGDPAQATQHAEHALAIALELGVELSTAVVRRVLAQIALHQHNIPTATAYMEQSLASLRQLGHRYELGRALYWQARILHAAGELEQARATLQEARQVFEELHAQRDLALVQTFEQEIGQQHAP
jgi:predicted ATPase